MGFWYLLLSYSITERASQDGGQSSTHQDEFNLGNYDEDQEGTAETLGIGSLAELENDAEENFSESDDSDKEDEIIKSTDNLILVGHVEGDASSLEVYGKYFTNSTQISN